MSYVSTGVNAISAEEAGLSCANYYSDGTVLDFTNNGTIDIITNGVTDYSQPLTGINFPVDDWGSSSVQLLPDSDPFTIDASQTGTLWTRRQLVQFDIDGIFEGSPLAKYAKMVVGIQDGSELEVVRSTNIFDISKCTNMLEFIEALKKAMGEEGVDMDLDLCEVFKVDSEYYFTIRTCEAGKTYDYVIYFYDENMNLIDYITAVETRSAQTYETPRSAFIVITVTYGAGNKTSASKSGCGCGGNSGCSPAGGSSSGCGNSSKDVPNTTQNVLKWTNLDLLNKFGKDEEVIWDNLSKILIHSGLQNASEDDDCQVRPIVLWNKSGIIANVKIMMAN